MEVGEDPLAVRRAAPARASPAPLAEAAVELVELAGDVGERLALDAAPGFVGELRRQRLVLGEARERGRGELRLLAELPAARRSRRPRQPPRARPARGRRARGRRSRPRSGSAPALAVPGGAHVRAAAQPALGSSAGPRAASSAGRRAPSRAARASPVRPRGRAVVRSGATRARPAAASRRAGRAPGRRPRTGSGTPREAAARQRGRLGRRGDERVDSGQQLLASRLGRAGSRGARARRSLRP